VGIRVEVVPPFLGCDTKSGHMGLMEKNKLVFG